MIAINIPKRKITFKKGLSGIEKYSILKNILWQQGMLMFYNFPNFNVIGYRVELIPDIIYFEEDKNLWFV